jgi:hypothetical protein
MNGWGHRWGNALSCTRTRLCSPLLPLTPSSLHTGGTQEPRWGQARPIRRTQAHCAPHLLVLGSSRPFPSAWGCPHDSLNVPLKHETLVTWNTWMQHLNKADETFRTYTCNICVKTMQHLDKTLATWRYLLQHKNKTVKTFGTYSCYIYMKHMQNLDQNACNIRLKHMKHFEQTLATCF